MGPGGLSALPLDYVYLDGSKTNKRTDPFLKLCNGGICRLNGSEAYRSILGYFTTTNIHPNEVHELGWKNLNRIYPQVFFHWEYLFLAKTQKPCLYVASRCQVSQYTAWKVSKYKIFLVSIFLSSDWIQENTDQKNSAFGHFSRSGILQSAT